MARAAQRSLVAFLDGQDSPDISNPIHSSQVAREYGFRAALVGGVTVYGWTAPAVIEALGDSWLDSGWVDVHFRRPVYPGDAIAIDVSEAGAGEWLVTLSNDRGERCLAGSVGLGAAPFHQELATPVRTAAEPRPAEIPYLTLASAPIGQDLRPMAVPYTAADALAYVTDKQRDTSPRWLGENGRIHPGWIAARMTPLLHHSYDYSPAIHTRSQIEHVAPARVGQTVTVAGRMIDAFERNGHHYAVTDGIILAEAGELLARIRHTTIFRPAVKPAEGRG